MGRVKHGSPARPGACIFNEKAAKTSHSHKLRNAATGESPARVEHVFTGLAQMGGKGPALHRLGTRNTTPEMEGGRLQFALHLVPQGGQRRGVLIPEVRPYH